MHDALSTVAMWASVLASTWVQYWRHDSAMKTSRPKSTDAHLYRQIAVTAMCDPRSVQKLYTGGCVQPLLALRIMRAIAELGLTPPDGA